MDGREGEPTESRSPPPRSPERPKLKNPCESRRAAGEFGADAVPDGKSGERFPRRFPPGSMIPVKPPKPTAEEDELTSPRTRLAARLELRAGERSGGTLLGDDELFSAPSPPPPARGVALDERFRSSNLSDEYCRNSEAESGALLSSRSAIPPFRSPRSVAQPAEFPPCPAPIPPTVLPFPVVPCLAWLACSLP